jgi:hypothetical protein
MCANRSNPGEVHVLKSLGGFGVLLALTFVLALNAPGILRAQDEPEERFRGIEGSIQAITESGQDVEARLTQLLSELPQDAHQGIERAIEANREGRQRALEVLEGLREKGGPASARERRRTEAQLGQALNRSEEALLNARERVPEQARERLSEALERHREGVQHAFRSAGLERPAAIRPDRPGRRPEGVGRGERPRNERPERPARPDRPGWPAGGN